MEENDNEYGENPVDDMMADFDYHINTGALIKARKDVSSTASWAIPI